MAVSTISLYPSSVYDFDLGSRCVPSSSTASSPPQKQMVGGLSCLFSSPSSSVVKHASSSSYSSSYSCVAEEFRSEELGSSSFVCSFGSYMKRDHQSPVSVFHSPVSCSSSVGGIGSSRSSLMRFTPGRDGSSFRLGNDRLFSRNALGSCLDYSPSYVELGSAALAEELTFKLDGNFKESSYESIPYAKDLLLDAQTRHKIFFDELVVKAFHEAEVAHKGQTRASGAPYLQHCVETGVLLAMVGADATVVAAGILHDILDDSSVGDEYILQTFGVEVAGLVKGVSELSHLSKLARESNTANRTVEADRLHTVFLAMADLRAVLIKLADRLHNMMTLEALPIDKQQRFAKETLQIFAPLANRLGIASWKEQLENLCFKFLYPDQHEELSAQLLKSFDEEMVSSAGDKLEQALKDGEISYHDVSGRHKSLYSTFCKMLKKKLTIDEIHDICGLRLIVEKEEDCYKALEIIHQLWSAIPEKSKDYIQYPKCNGYRSLHTVVVGEGLGPLEVQIRTREMHLQAEFGFAAHWRYKEGNCEHSSFVVKMVEWAQSVITWHCETMVKARSFVECSDSKCKFPFHSEDCRYLYKPQCSDDNGPVFVIAIENDKGTGDWLANGCRPPMSVEEFPANSTIMDLLERAGRGSSRWTPYRYLTKEELQPTVNNVPVSDPTYKLKMGDVVNLTPTISDNADYREEIQRMYDKGLSVSGTRPASTIARG